MVKAMRETGIFPDFIVVDGAEGGTGAAPVEFADNLGMPMRESLLFVHNTLVGAGVRDRIKVGAAGKIVSAFDIAAVLGLGADWTNAGRGFMFALGCIQSLSCHTNRCPVGVATQDGKYLLVIERDELKDLGITKLKVLRVVQEAIDELRTQQALLIPEGVAVKKWQLKRRFAAFLSHNKAEAAAEARLAKEKLVELLKQDVFLDSDDLQNLDRLLSSVRDSDMLILFQTRNMLSRELTQVDRAWLPSQLWHGRYV